MDPQRLGASHESLSCPTPGGDRSRENVKRLPWGQQAGEGRGPGWPSPWAGTSPQWELIRDTAVVPARAPGPAGAAARAGAWPPPAGQRGVAGDVAPGQWGTRFPRPYVGAVQRDLPGWHGGRGPGRGCRGGAQGGPLCPAAAPASVGSWGGCRLGSEPMRLGCEGPGRAEAGAVSSGACECPAPVRSSSAGGSSEQRPRAARPRPCVHKDVSSEAGLTSPDIFLKL